MLSRMLNCCQRFEKLTFPSIRSGLPRWTKVRSCRMSPLGRRDRETAGWRDMWRGVLGVSMLHYVTSRTRFCFLRGGCAISDNVDILIVDVVTVWPKSWLECSGRMRFKLKYVYNHYGFYHLTKLSYWLVKFSLIPENRLTVLSGLVSINVLKCSTGALTTYTYQLNTHSHIEKHRDTHTLLQVGNAGRFHFSQSCPVCSEWWGAVNQCAVLL